MCGGSENSIWYQYWLNSKANVWKWSPIPTNEVSEVFAIFFDKKIKKVVNSVIIDKGVYNCKKMVYPSNELFMECDSNRSCVLSLKHYNSEGCEHMLQRILCCKECLLKHFTRLIFKCWYQFQVLFFFLSLSYE
jgi:hypothetical protein